MKRKIIRQGHNTLTVTLPSKWTKILNLKAGDEIDLIERESGLFLSGKKAPIERCAELDITGMDIPTIWKELMAIYRQGYPEARITFPEGLKLENPYKYLTKHRANPKLKQEPSDAADVLYQFFERFIGYEIVQSGRRSVVVKQMGDPSPKEFANAYRRIYLLIGQMLSEIVEAMENGQPKSIAHIHNSDINVDKFHDYCARLLNQTASHSPQKSRVISMTIFLLELIGDELKNIAVHLNEEYAKGKFSTIIPYAKTVSEEWNAIYDLTFSFSKEKVRGISEIDAKLYLGINGVYAKTTDPEKEILHHFRIICRYLNSLLELRIEEEWAE